MRAPSWGRKAIIIVFWLIVWQCAGAAVHNDLILVGPVTVLRSLAVLLGAPDFWRSIAISFGKIGFGFLSGFICGIALGSAAWRFPLLKDTLEPLMALIKSIPVASFVILALIWIGSTNLSVLISFLVVLPMIYINTIAGLASTDQKLLEMALVFRVSSWKKIFSIYRPALIPYLESGCSIALGMSFKSGVAAEVIGVPSHSIGEHLYMAKIYLSTGDLFAWTLVIIVFSALFEKLFLTFLKMASTPIRPPLRQTPPSVVSKCLPASRDGRPPATIRIEHLSKSYGGQPVLTDLTLTFHPGTVYCLMAPSGAGKTTLFKILLGLESPDGGTIRIPNGIRLTAVFQEDRLCESLTPADNVRMVLPKDAADTRRSLRGEMCKLLPAESIDRPVSTLSGGMKRRVAILRALLAPSDLILMDEPFTGLDEAMRKTVIQWILDTAGERLVIVSTHQEEDVALLGGTLIRLPS